MTNPHTLEAESTGPQPFVIPPRPKPLSVVAHYHPGSPSEDQRVGGMEIGMGWEAPGLDKTPVDPGNGNGKRPRQFDRPRQVCAFPDRGLPISENARDGIGLCVTKGWGFIDLDRSSTRAGNSAPISRGRRAS
jgi:hypothetical protein